MAGGLLWPFATNIDSALEVGHQVRRLAEMVLVIGIDAWAAAAADDGYYVGDPDIAVPVDMHDMLIARGAGGEQGGSRGGVAVKTHNYLLKRCLRLIAP